MDGQLICNKISTWNLNFENMKFGWETPKQMIDGHKSTNIPHCINNLHAPKFIVKNSR